MKHFIGATAATCFVMLIASQPAHAMDDIMEQMMCPVKAISNEEAESLGAMITGPDATIPENEFVKLEAVVSDCATENGFDAQQSDRSLSFLIAMLSASGYEHKLTALDIDVALFEELLADKSPEELNALNSEPVGNPIVAEAFNILKTNASGKATTDAAGLVADYLVHLADLRLTVMAIMEAAE